MLPLNTKPLSPKEAEENHLRNIPDFVIAAVNRLLSNQANHKKIRIGQDEVIRHATSIAEANGKYVTRDEFFNNHWLDFEALYRQEGWGVYYDKPGYSEDYNAFWVFTKDKC